MSRVKGYWVPLAEEVRILQQRVAALEDRVERLEEQLQELQESMKALGAEVVNNEEITYRYAQGLRW